MYELLILSLSLLRAVVIIKKAAKSRTRYIHIYLVRLFYIKMDEEKAEIYCPYRSYAL